MNKKAAIKQAIQFGFEIYERSSSIGNIICMGEELYQQVVSEKSIAYNKDLYKEENNYGWLIPGVCFLYFWEPQDDFFGYEPVTDITAFLKNSTLAIYEKYPEQRLKLVWDEGSIFDHLPGLLTRNIKRGLPSLKYLRPLHFSADIPEPLKNKIIETDSFSGRIGGCGADHDVYGDDQSMVFCGEPACSSEFAWIVGGICYLYFKGSGGSIDLITFFPFKT